jgi:DNA-binding NarL/FixJ family response regulator
MASLEERRTAVLLDQHPLWLDAVENVLAKIGVEVVGKTTRPTRALELVEQHHPDVLVTGIDLPGAEMDGVACLRRARERVPSMKAVVLSMHEDHQHVDAALEAGASAYVVKKAHPEDLAAAIRQAFDHSIYLPGSRSVTAPVAVPTADETPGLTRREVEILQLVAEGYSNAQLGKMLWVTEQTVKFHLSNIYRKLDVSNRTEASRWAQRQGLLPAAPSAAAATAGVA